jgi:multiple sugar transport system substrate-binding protein
MARLAHGMMVIPLALVTAACGSGGEGEEQQTSGQVEYWLWDANQLPAYQKCADAFQAKNADVTVKITQYGWDDYWTKVTTGFVSGTAPDVFTDHLQKYPEFASTNQLEPLDTYMSRDGVSTAAFQPGLADLWVAKDGKRYGMPKDFDTIAIFYNEALTTAAGITKAQMDSLAWNPNDGGTYQQVIARLTVDQSGKRGNEPGFDKNNVKTYGLGLAGAGSGLGQTEYSMYTGSNGWTATDKLWDTKYKYDDPKFQQAIGWWKSLIDKGFMPPLEKTVGVPLQTQYGAGSYAMVTEGSWNTGSYTTINGVKSGIAPVPVGPTGKRASMYNGLADSIWAGSSKKEPAWKWVKFLGSTECQDLVADSAIVFPAITTSTEKAEAAFKAKGIDVSGFLIHTKEKTTFLPPVTERAAEVSAIMGPAMEAVMGGSAPVTSLTEANKQVNALFG